MRTKKVNCIVPKNRVFNFKLIFTILLSLLIITSLNSIYTTKVNASSEVLELPDNFKGSLKLSNKPTLTKYSPHNSSYTGAVSELLGSGSKTINVTSSSTKIQALYKKSATYNGQKLDVYLTIAGFSHRYSSKGAFVYLSKSLSRGFYYSGYKEMKVHYTFYKTGTSEKVKINSDGSLGIDSLNGFGNSSDKWNYSLNGGTTGEFAESLDGKTPYVIPRTKNYKSNIQSYRSPDLGRTVTGGGKNLTFPDSGQGRRNTRGNPEFYRNSIYYLGDGSSSFNLLVGSGVGSAWFALSTAGKPTPKEKIIEDDGEKDDEILSGASLVKTVDKKIINKRGDTFTYKITGKLPTISLQKVTKWHYVTRQYFPGFPSEPITYQSYEPYDTWEYRNFDNNDSFTFVDNLPKEVTPVTWAISNGLKTTSGFSDQSSGNSVKFRLSGNALQKSNTFTLYIRVKADKLPNPKKAGWLTMPNTAAFNVNTYNDKSSGTSNKVTTKIQSFEANIWHYDFDPDDLGDNSFKSMISTLGDDLTYDSNFHEDSGVLKNEELYGYEDDDFTINVLQNEKLTNDDNQTGRYRFAYGDQKEIKRKFGNESRDYFLPYVIPKMELETSRLIIDTDKLSNKLPFELNMKTTSTLFRDFSDYDGANAAIIIKSDSGKTLYEKQASLSSLLKNEDNGEKYLTYKDKLNTSSLSSEKGSKVPVNVSISFTNPKEIFEYKTEMDSYGYVASQKSLTENDFDNGVAKLDGVERTIKYYDDNDVKELWERLTINQKHDASAKTGYGMKADMKLQYASNVDINKYGKEGSDLDFAFPNAFKEANNNILYGSNSNKNAKDANNVDRLLKKSENQRDLGENETKSNDEITDSNKEVDDNFSANKTNPGYYETQYQFYDRISSNGIGKESGTISLKNDNNPLSKNDKSVSGSSMEAGNKMFTPYWMKLGLYNTAYQTIGQATSVNGKKEDDARLGANWFTIGVNRPIDFYAHMFLDKGSKSESHDELSVQPILSNKQKPFGFNSEEQNWLSTVR